MADNVTFQDASLATPADGTVVSTDEAASGHVQRMKLAQSANGSDTHVQADSDGLLVNLGTNNDVTVTGTVGISAGAEVKITDGTDDVAVTSEGNLQTITPNRTASGTLDALDEAVTISTDGMASLTIQTTDSAFNGTLVLEGSLDGSDWRYFSAGQQDGVTFPTNSIAPDDEIYQADASLFAQARVRVSAYTGGSVAVLLQASSAPVVNAMVQSVQIVDSDGQAAQVTGTALSVAVASIAAGTNNIGDVDVASIAAGDNNIGNVDIVTLPALVAGSANIGDVDVLTVPSPLSTAGNGTAATAHRVTIASDSTGQVAIASIAAGTTNIGDVDVLTVPAPLSTTGGGTEATAHRVTIASDSTGVLSVDDNGGALTVDGSVSLLATSLTIGGVDETGTNAVDALAVGGGTPHDSVDSGNPIKVGMKAANALPTAVANNDRANAISDLWGRQMVTHIDPAQQKHQNKTWTSTQTGTDVITPTSGKKLAITSVVLGAYGTTAGRCILWFGDNADTTFTQDTDQVLIAASFAPSSSSKPGLVFTPSVPVFCTTADRELHITTDANLSIDATIEYYEW